MIKIKQKQPKSGCQANIQRIGKKPIDRETHPRKQSREGNKTTYIDYEKTKPFEMTNVRV